MWKTGPWTLNDWTTGPEVLQWGNGISRGPETGSSDLRSEHQKGKKRKRRGASSPAFVICGLFDESCSDRYEREAFF